MVSNTGPKPAVSSGTKPPPLVLILAHSLMGHISPMCRIASFASHAPDLAHAVYFLGPSSHRARIEATGATFLPLLGKADIDDQRYYANPPSARPIHAMSEEAGDEQKADNEAKKGKEKCDEENAQREAYTALPWYERLLIDVREQCLEPLPDAWRSFINALEIICERLREEGQSRDVVVIAEAMFHGILPLFYDAPLPESISSCLYYKPNNSQGKASSSNGVSQEERQQEETDIGDDDDNGAGANTKRIKSRLHTLCVSVTTPAIRSKDCPPLGYPFPGYDPTPSGRALNSKLWDRSWASRRARPLTRLLDRKLRDAGARRGLGKKGDSFSNGSNNGEEEEVEEEVLFGGLNYTHHPTILQLGVPGLEYPRSDWPPGFRFAGFVQGNITSTGTTTPHHHHQQQQQQQRPPPPPDPPQNFPWWPEILANSALPPNHPQRKKVIVVTQGTVETNPQDLILPTIEAFSSRSNYLIVPILGWKDAKFPPPPLPSSSSSSSSSKSDNNKKSSSWHWPPENVRPADFLNYDAILRDNRTDVFVHNAGFGALCHGIANGVVQVCCGEGMDKGENGKRVAWSGIGVDLLSSSSSSSSSLVDGHGHGSRSSSSSLPPSPESVREAVERVLEPPPPPPPPPGRDNSNTIAAKDEKGGIYEVDERRQWNGFKERVEELRRQSEEINCFGVLEEELRRLR